MKQNIILENKEIAYLIWGVIGLLFALLYKPLRNSFTELLHAFFVLKLLIIILLEILYISVCVLVLYKLGLWDFPLLKETIIWIIMTGSVTMFKIIEKEENKKYFIESLKNTLKWSVVCTFIIGLYSFNIWFEITAVPIAIIISLLLVFSERDKNFQKLNTLLKNIVLIIVFILALYIIYQVIIDYSKYFNLGTVKQFLLPTILAVLFIPYLFALSLYSNYEVVFAVLPFAIKEKKLLQYAKIQALLKFNLNMSGLQRWRYNAFLIKIHNKKDVQQSINKIIDLQKIELNPPKVKEHLGWSPYVAKDFLNGNNIRTGYYYNYLDDKWTANSPYIKQDDSFLCNDISYAIDGTEQLVNSLQLVLNVYDSSLKTTDHGTLLSNSEILYQKVFNKTLPENLKNNIQKGYNFKVVDGLFEVSLKREEMKNITKGYCLSFEIKYKAV